MNCKVNMAYKLCLLLAVSVISCFAYPPTISDLQRHLASAKIIWAVDKGPVTFIIDHGINDCSLRIVQNVAFMEMLDVETITSFDDPNTPQVVTHTRTYNIHINGNCAWNPQWLARVVLHEYGHILVADDTWHSENTQSVMYYIVDMGIISKQTITKEDRAKVRR